MPRRMYASLLSFVWSGVVPATPRRTLVLYHFARQPVSLVVTVRSIAEAILPSSVPMPVATTMQRARPLVTWEPANTWTDGTARGQLEREASLDR